MPGMFFPLQNFLARLPSKPGPRLHRQFQALGKTAFVPRALSPPRNLPASLRGEVRPGGGEEFGGCGCFAWGQAVLSLLCCCSWCHFQTVRGKKKPKQPVNIFPFGTKAEKLRWVFFFFFLEAFIGQAPLLQKVLSPTALKKAEFLKCQWHAAGSCTSL